MRVRGSDTRHAEHVDEELRELVGLRHDPPQRARAGIFEHLHQVTHETPRPPGLTLVPGVGVRLPACPAYPRDARATSFGLKGPLPVAVVVDFVGLVQQQPRPTAQLGSWDGR